MLNLIAWDKVNDTSIIPERLPVDGEWARHPSGVKKQYNVTVAPDPEPILISVDDITGTVFLDETKTKATAYENVNLTITGTLDIEDRDFSLPIRRDDGRLFLFLAQVRSGVFSVTINFPTVGQFTYSDNECNIDLPYKVFTVNTVKFDILRTIT